MKKYAFLTALFVLLPFMASAATNLNLREFKIFNDVSRDSRHEKIRWYKGESVRYEIDVRRGNSAVAMPSDVLPVWKVWEDGNQTSLVVIKTGTLVNAGMGRVRVDLTPTEANAPSGSYISAMQLWEGENYMGIAGYSDLEIIWSPAGDALGYVGVSPADTFYRTANPSNFVSAEQASNWFGSASGEATAAQSNQFYSILNPSQYVSQANASNWFGAATGEATTQQSNQFLIKTGDSMTGPLTNNAGFYGDGAGLTNLSVAGGGDTFATNVLENLANVVGTPTNGQILKYAVTNSSWNMAEDNSGGGAGGAGVFLETATGDIYPTNAALASSGGGSFTAGFTNQVDAAYGSAIAGGVGNYVDGGYATIAGGQNNQINGTGGFIGAGVNNDLDGGVYGVIGGGNGNDAASDEDYVFIGGGQNITIDNTVGSADWGVVCGGQSHLLRGEHSAIVGGLSHQIGNGADHAFVGGGQANEIRGDWSSILGGFDGDISSGSDYSMILGGIYNHVDAADYALAAGRNAYARHNGAFVWADSSVVNIDYVSQRTHSFNLRASGGVFFGANATTNPACLYLNPKNTNSFISNTGGSTGTMYGTEDGGTTKTPLF